MTIEDKDVDGFLALLAARRAERTVDAYRRNLQEAFVDQMDRLINTPLVTLPPPQFAFFPGVTATNRPTDARALARFELQGLQTSLRAAAPKAPPGDRSTRAHFVDLQARIDRVLNSREPGVPR